MFEYFKLDKDEMLYSSEVFYSIIPVYIALRIFIFYLFEKSVKVYSVNHSKTYAKLSDENKSNWTSKANSVFHAVLVSILCIPNTITDVTHAKSDKDLAFGITKRRVDVMLWTIAYLFYDLFMMFKKNKNQLAGEMILHHIVCAVAFLIGIYYDIGTSFMGSFIINELTTPQLHLRWYLSRMKLRDTTFAYVNNILFGILYIIVRGFWNTYILYAVLAGYVRYYDELVKCAVPNMIVFALPLLVLSHWILNLYWIYIILLHAVQPKKATSKEGEDGEIEDATEPLNTPNNLPRRRSGINVAEENEEKNQQRKKEEATMIVDDSDDDASSLGQSIRMGTSHSRISENTPLISNNDGIVDNKVKSKIQKLRESIDV